MATTRSISRLNKADGEEVRPHQENNSGGGRTISFSGPSYQGGV